MVAEFGSLSTVHCLSWLMHQRHRLSILSYWLQQYLPAELAKDIPQKDLGVTRGEKRSMRQKLDGRQAETLWRNTGCGIHVA